MINHLKLGVAQIELDLAKIQDEVVDVDIFHIKGFFTDEGWIVIQQICKYNMYTKLI